MVGINAGLTANNELMKMRMMYGKASDFRAYISFNTILLNL